MSHELGCYQYTIRVKKHVGMEDLLVFDQDVSSLQGYSHGDGIAIVYTTRKQMRQFAQTLDWVISHEEGDKIDPFPQPPQERIVFDPAFLIHKAVPPAAENVDRCHWFVWIKPGVDLGAVKAKVQTFGPDAFVRHVNQIIQVIATDAQMTSFCDTFDITTDCRRGAKFQPKP